MYSSLWTPCHGTSFPYFLDCCSYTFLNKTLPVALSPQSDYAALFLPRSDFWLSSYFIITLCFCHVSLRSPAVLFKRQDVAYVFSQFLDRCYRFLNENLPVALSLQPNIVLPDFYFLPIFCFSSY